MNENIALFDGVDEAMRNASKSAQRSFKYFWRELWWENRRIVPALDMAAVKLPFSDGVGAAAYAGAEHMWVGEIDFDGDTLSGILMNAPNWLQSVNEGDAVSVPFAHLTDWMISADGLAFGAYTVQHIRATMDPDERQEHDDAWGLDFGDPSGVRLEIWREKEPVSADREHEFADHPACTNMLETVAEHLREDPAMVRAVDDIGWTPLHHEALAGNLGIVKLLLGSGADAAARTPSGRTAADLARGIGWTDIADYLDGQTKA